MKVELVSFMTYSFKPFSILKIILFDCATNSWVSQTHGCQISIIDYSKKKMVSKLDQGGDGGRIMGRGRNASFPAPPAQIPAC